MASGSNNLAKELSLLRGMRGDSLRDVEKATGITNAYLWQLENGKAENPSPHVLHKLASFYKVPYESLMEAAGYLERASPPKMRRQTLTSLQAALMSAKLSEEEQTKVAEFIEFLRSQRRHRGK